uniref:Complement C3-like n=1 Tax=Kryptolebias marmoratus TaxID=37003 RepID=A0A3Q3B4F4_KRYMA
SFYLLLLWCGLKISMSFGHSYLFGKEVYGTAYVVFGIMENSVKKSLPHSLSRVQNGDGQVTLKREQITQTFPDINALVGNSIYVAVSVLTESGSEMVEAELRGIQIVTSPYRITFTKTPKYFKPGMSFDVAVEVVNPDDSPADNIPVVVNPGGVRGFTAPNGMARLTINTQATDATLQISPTQPKDITYLITSRGQLVKSERYQTKGQTLISLILTVTKEMLPSFRILAYYHPTDNEVVSDSVWVDVKDSCMGSLTLESARQVPSYEPRKMFSLRVTGDPGATVGLVAVDKGVYVLNNKNRLTQKKMWDIVEKYDTGCTPGGGSNSMNVFFDAGLLFESNTASGTPYRQELKCKTASRRKRATTILEVRTSLLSKYGDEQQRKCCLDGMKEIPLSYTCERRAEYILDGQACVDAFLNCCNEMQNQIVEKKEENLQLARSEEDDSYTDSNEIVSRTNFPESWLWSDIILPPCTQANCHSTSLVRNVPLQDSITTWQFTGISLSRTLGLCVGEPLEVIVRKEFFIDLRLPYSAVRGEQLEIKAILHNYSPDPITVRVELIEEENVCSAASKRGKFRQEVNVGAHTTRSVPYIIIPMKEGERSIEVKAAVKDSYLNDGVKKKLRVVLNGLHVIFYDFVLCVSLLAGREQVSGLVENAISGNSMGTLIRAPGGCGEQNMIYTTLPVIATTYLDKTNQWETVGFQKRSEAIQHIKNGYKHQLQYRKNDGSFSVWTHHSSSSWLTAYVARVFAIAYNLVAVESDHICGAVKYLILNAQQPDGMFREVGKVIHKEMMVSAPVNETDDDLLPSSIDKSISYLETRLPTLTNPYAVAITSYALANENKLNRDILYKFASPELSHWPVPGGKMFTLEATAYALLALVRAKVSSSKYVLQATIMVYHAVAEYWTNAKEPEYDLNVDILLPGRSKPDKFSFNRENHYTTRTSKVS